MSSAAAHELRALLARVGADETASSFAFVAAVAAGAVPSSSPAPPVTYGQVCECRHLAEEHKHDGELTLCLGDSFVVLDGHRVPVPCGCRTWRHAPAPLSAFRP